MIVYGKQIFLYILEKHPQIINEFMLSKEIDKKLFSQLTRVGKKIIKLDNKKAQALAQGGNHQGFFLDIEELQFADIAEIKKTNFIVVLDGLTDVGNIGAITRTAYSLGVDAIVVSGVKSLKTQAIIRSSSGAMLDMPFCLYPNSLDIANELKQTGFSLVGAHMDGEDLDSFNANSDKIALFLGSEGRGLSKRVVNKLDFKVSIKMVREFDSLNVSVAAGILIYKLGKK